MACENLKIPRAILHSAASIVSVATPVGITCKNTESYNCIVGNVYPFNIQIVQLVVKFGTELKTKGHLSQLFTACATLIRPVVFETLVC
jgi:hypothetical protein